MDDYEDDEGPDGDGCPWLEPVNRYDDAVNRIACAIVGHAVEIVNPRAKNPYRVCRRSGCEWESGDCPRNWRAVYSTVDASYPVANGVIRGITDLERI